MCVSIKVTLISRVHRIEVTSQDRSYFHGFGVNGFNVLTGSKLLSHGFGVLITWGRWLQLIVKLSEA